MVAKDIQGFSVVPLFVAGPPLSMDNVMAVLGGVAGKWRDVGMELHVPRRSMDVIASESTSDLQCLMRGTLRYWIRHDPRASWRRLIWRLDWSLNADLNKLSNDIRSYAEKLTGQYYTVVSSYIRMCMLLDGPYAPLHLKKTDMHNHVN